MGRHRHKVMTLANVVGCGWGAKRTRGRKTDQEGLIVFVRRKTPLPALHPRDVVPLRIDDVATDVIEVGDVRLLAHPRRVVSEGKQSEPERTARWRPVRPGISFGHVAVTAGTLGAVVKDARTGQLYFLSNNHVAANATDGHDGRAGIGDGVLQPGAYDGGTPEDDVIGHLERFVPLHPLLKTPHCPWARLIEQALNVPLALLAKHYAVRLFRQHPEDNLVDVALVKPIDGLSATPDIVGIGPVRGIAEAHVDMRVKKSGRTSGVTAGEVVAIGATMHVGLGENGLARFADQVVTTPLAQPGDSGSLVVDEENRAVGLLFAGSDQATLCNRMSTVCTLLDITL